MADLSGPVRCGNCGGQVEDDWAMCGWCGTAIDADASPTRVVQVDPPAQPENEPSGVLEPGTAVQGRYRIDAVLGRGGFGVTYRAWDLRLMRNVALKELFPLTARRHGTRVVVDTPHRDAFEDALIRFRREAAALARFNHPGIVRVFEVLEANDTAYLVMELIEGSSMSDLLRKRARPLSVAEVLDVIGRVGSALAVVHDAGLLHRDVNPSNVMLEGTNRVVLIDFGLARRFGDEVSGAMTRAVTPGYAPPEQYAGSVHSGPPCDVFGLAATAYKLLTGVTPTNVFDRQAGVHLAAPVELFPTVPRLVSDGVMDGMELDPGHRPVDAAAFIDRLGLHGVASADRVLVTETVADATHVDLAISSSPSTTPAPAMAPAPAQVPAPLPSAAAQRGDDDVPFQVAPLRSSGFAPFHDGSAPVVGPGERSRGWVTWPVTAALCALASASPILVGGLLALVVLPILATVGDLDAHRNRQRIGAQRRRWHDARASVVVPVRFVRNMAVGALRAVPAAAVAAIGVVVADALADGGATAVWRDATIRLCGVAVALALVVPARGGGRSFRSDPGVTMGAAWAMEHRRRPGTRALVVWVIAIAVTALALWLDPELWPLR